MGKKLIIIGFLVVILIAIPLTVYILQQQTKAPSANPSTNISLSISQQTITVGQTFSVSVNIDPGSNHVSFVKLNISYDKTKLATNGTGIVPNASLNLLTLEGPSYNQCSGNLCYITVAYGIAANRSSAITSADTLATISFKAIASTTTNTGSTTIGFGNNNAAYSIKQTDQPTQNVIVNTQSLQVTIADVPTSTPTDTLTPTSGGGGGGGGGGGAPTDTLTPTSGGGGRNNTNTLLCNSLTADNSSSSSAPFTVNFTVVGSDSTSTVNGINFNFGDGSNQNLTSGGGISTGSINAQISHTYQTNGTFSASAILTDNTGATSSSSSCLQTITVGTNLPTNTPTLTTSSTPITQMKTGPGDKFVILGGLGGIITLIGGVILFGL